jgi:Holliday junction resolvase RusA-like endonuclease
MTIQCTIPGTPVPQPRPRATIKRTRTGRTVPHVYDPGYADRWKQAVGIFWSLAAQGRKFTQGPVEVYATFYFSPLKSDKKTQENDAKKCTKPDVDNLAKALLDALTDAGAWGDDGQVFSLAVSKRYHVTGPFTSLTVCGGID